MNENHDWWWLTLGSKVLIRYSECVPSQPTSGGNLRGEFCEIWSNLIGSDLCMICPRLHTGVVRGCPEDSTVPSPRRPGFSWVREIKFPSMQAEFAQFRAVHQLTTAGMPRRSKRSVILIGAIQRRRTASAIAVDTLAMSLVTVSPTCLASSKAD
jgi:hypothetical protein